MSSNWKKCICTVGSRLLLFAVLFGLTLLVMEIPGWYYQNADRKLAKQQQTDFYDLKTVNKDMILFSDKVKVFGLGKEIADWKYGVRILDAEMFSEQELDAGFQTIASELLMLYKEQFEDYAKYLSRSETERSGMRATVFYEDQNKTYSWDVGLLTIGDEMQNGFFLYDMESGKLFVADIYALGSIKAEEELFMAIESYYREFSVAWDREGTYYGNDIYDVAPEYYGEKETDRECFYLHLSPFSEQTIANSWLMEGIFLRYSTLYEE